MPEFTEATASAWFRIIEAQFVLSRITQSPTKFYHVMGVLLATTVARLSLETLDSQNYEVLKAAVLFQVERSKPELFESLIHPSILKGRPSICLSNLQKTASQVGVGDDFVRHRFLQSLPSNISPVVAAQTNLNLYELGKLADDLFAMTDLKTHVNVIENRSFKHEKRRPTIQDTPTRLSGVQPFHSGQRQRVCRAHIYYGPNARTCRQWCTWPAKDQCRVQPNSRPTSPAFRSTTGRSPSPHPSRIPRLQGNDQGAP